MLISDWSSDVCSSDLPLLIDKARCAQPQEVHALARRLVQALRGKRKGGGVESLIKDFSLSSQEGVKSGRESSRERECMYGETPVVAGSRQENKELITIVSEAAEPYTHKVSETE